MCSCKSHEPKLFVWITLCGRKSHEGQFHLCQEDHSSVYTHTNTFVCPLSHIYVVPKRCHTVPKQIHLCDLTRSVCSPIVSMCPSKEAYTRPIMAHFSRGSPCGSWTSGLELEHSKNISNDSFDHQMKGKVHQLNIQGFHQPKRGLIIIKSS